MIARVSQIFKHVLIKFNINHVLITFPSSLYTLYTCGVPRTSCRHVYTTCIASLHVPLHVPFHKYSVARVSPYSYRNTTNTLQSGCRPFPKPRFILLKGVHTGLSWVIGEPFSPYGGSPLSYAPRRIILSQIAYSSTSTESRNSSPGPWFLRPCATKKSTIERRSCSLNSGS